MPRIVNNRICYADHNVVLDEKLWKQDRAFAGNYLIDMANHLTERGRAGLHRRELGDMNNNGSWTIELPVIRLVPAYQSEYAERHPESNRPTDMLCMMMLNNGNYDKVIWVRQVGIEEGFKTLWLQAYQQGLRIGKAQRRVAEAQFRVAHLAALAQYNPPMIDTTL
jgi:hypothetical protein